MYVPVILFAYFSREEELFQNIYFMKLYISYYCHYGRVIQTWILL